MAVRCSWINVHDAWRCITLLKFNRICFLQLLLVILTKEDFVACSSHPMTISIGSVLAQTRPAAKLDQKLTTVEALVSGMLFKCFGHILETCEVLNVRCFFSAGYFIYTEASTPRRYGQKASISTPKMAVGAPKRCVTFWYHMFGEGMGTIQVYAAFSSAQRYVLRFARSFPAVFVV